jgi:ABC-type multidrug transport system ATPase subunit
MVAIMGPSGSGKTSLLNCLTCRHNLSDSSYRIGTVTVNGQKLNQDSDFGLAGAFVQQDDILTEVFTVRELFEFACKIRLGFTGEKMNQRVQEVIDRLGLNSCKETIIGGWMRRGISGGERKRTSIGYELITNPSLLLMDEPTSGLDSTTSLRIMKMMQWEAKERGMSILATIHQPNSDLLFTFDRVILMSEGYTIFNGPPG